MNLQLLRRRSETPAVPVAAPAAGGRPPAAARTAVPAAGAAPAARRVLRRPAVLALVAAGAAGLAGLAWVLLSAPADPAGTGPATFPGAPASAGPAGAPTPSPVTTTDPGDAAGIATGRDPFEGDGALAGAPAGATASTATAAAPTSPPHTQPARTTTSAPAGLPTGLPTSIPSRAPRPSGAAATATVTANPTYLGLYGWNGNRAAFRVNAKAYSVARGAAFGSGLRFTGVVQRGGEACAVVAHSGGTVTVCPGQVLHIG